MPFSCTQDVAYNTLCFCVSITDFSTDGKWCYIVLWVVPRPSSLKIDWESLKSRLLSACPSCLILSYFNQQSSCSPPPQVYLLKVFCLDRKGLLHGKVRTPLPSSHFSCVFFIFWQDSVGFFFRCNKAPLWARTKHSKSQSDDNSRWQSVRPFLHHGWHVSHKPDSLIIAKKLFWCICHHLVLFLTFSIIWSMDIYFYCELLMWLMMLFLSF